MRRTVGQKLSAILAYFVQIECVCKNDFTGMGSWCRGLRCHFCFMENEKQCPLDGKGLVS